MITTATAGGLGFNPFSAIKSGVTTVARTAVKVATNPNVQRAAAAGAQAYAPGQYAQAQQVINQARGILRPPPGQAPPPMPMPMMPPPDMDQGAPPPVKSNGMMIAALVGAGLIVVLLMKK